MVGSKLDPNYLYYKNFVSSVVKFQNFSLIWDVSTQIDTLFIYGTSFTVYNNQTWLAQDVGTNYAAINAYITELWRCFFTCSLKSGDLVVNRKFLAWNHMSSTFWEISCITNEYLQKNVIHKTCFN